MRLVLALPHRNEAELQKLLEDLYDRSSPSYHKFLTVEDFTKRFGPSQEDYDAVISFAEAHGLSVVGTSRNRMNVDVEGPVARVEEAFHVTMRVYQHPTENRTFYAPDAEPTPDLSVPLWHISGLDNYSIPTSTLVHRTSLAQPQAGFTTGSCPSGSFCGSDMRAAYYGGTALTGAGQSLGLMEYYGTDLADLTTYFKNAKQTNNVPITVISTDGTSTSCLYQNGCDDTEQTLDMTQAIGMAPGLASLVMYVGATDAAIFNAMATANPLNAQLSSSWTWTPADPATDAPYFAEFAAQGQNLFQAAGDTGSWNSSSQDYPADSPFLTAVGGTDLETSGGGGAWFSETGWASGGGGISFDNFAIPSWQTATASGCSNCSTTYRNAPDVSGNANYTFYVCSDQIGCTANYYGGTSFATPMWAGYLALANQQAAANGGTALGFINPTLYAIGMGSSYTTDFHDITSGGNGYFATVGYDLATGWGSPNGSSLIDALTAGSAGPPTPTLTSISPSSGAPGANVSVTLTGTNFIAGASIIISGSGVTPSGLTVVSGTKITATFSIDSGATPGGYTVSVTTTNGNSGSVTFTVLNLTPTLTSISPSSGAPGASVPVTLTGTNFISGATLNISGSGVSYSGLSVVSSTQITATFSIASGASLAPYTVSVSTTNGNSGSVNFTVAQPIPTLTSISPSSGAPGASVPVTLTGTNFISGATLNISGSGVSYTGLSVVSGTQITATINIASGASSGGYSVSVSTTNGKSGSVTFTVAKPTPTLTSISPNSASTSSTTAVTLTGTNFVSGATLNIGTSGVTASGVTVVSSTQIDASFTVAANATIGGHNVSVSTSAGTSAAVTFTVNATPPSLSSISPSSGKPGTTVKVTVTGKNLTGNSVFQIPGGGITVNSVTAVGSSGTTVTANFVIASSAAPGQRHVSVQTNGGTSNTVPFTIE